MFLRGVYPYRHRARASGVGLRIPVGYTQTVVCIGESVMSRNRESPWLDGSMARV